MFNKNINLYTFQLNNNKWNFGDYFSKTILEKIGFNITHFTNKKNPSNKLDHILFAIGGMVNSYFCNRKVRKYADKIYAWGSGIGNDYRQISKRGLDPSYIKSNIVFTMSRGEITSRYSLLDEGILLGDPAYLSSLLFPFEQKKDNITFVKHYIDNIGDADILTNYKGTNNIVNMLLDEEKTDYQLNCLLQKIATSSFVFTSAMHGAIVAHSYGIPWAITKRRGVDISKEMKWIDTASAIGLSANDLKVCDNSNDGFQWWDSIKDKIKSIDFKYQKEILSTLPFNTL